MRVRVSFTVDIDTDAWAEAAEVRRDVQDYVRVQAIDHLDMIEMLTTP